MNVSPVEEWLQLHTGLDAPSLGSGVVSRAARARIDATGCTSVEDYIERLERSADERHALIDRVIVPETWFFRDRPALDALAQHVVCTWGPAHPGATFRVLSVPCSTGEEPYSLAMAFAMAGWPPEWLRIDAVDISRESLMRCRDGVYGRNSFRGADLAFRATFMVPEGRDTWRVSESVRVPVNFEQGNLLADGFPAGRMPYDAIFCRNLLIYFDRETQARAIAALDRLLAPEGWMAVGPAEPILLFEHGYAAMQLPSAFLLQRARPAEPSVPPSATRGVAKPLSISPRGRLAGRVVPVATARMSASAASVASAARAVPAPAVRAEISLAELQQLANAGRLREAAALGEALLAQQGSSADVFFLLAVVAEASGQLDHAESLYRKALYLEPSHADVLAHLALLAERTGDARGARGYRERAHRTRPKDAP